MLKNRYRELNIVEYTAGNYGTASTYAVASSFQGLIQTPSNSNTFRNGKDSSNVSGILFCDISVSLKEKDLIEDPINGLRYIVSGSTSQPFGVTGITPQAGQHAEYNLEFDNRGL